MAATKEKALIVLPGVLAHCQQFARPLVLEDITENVVYLDYDDRNFNPALEIENIVHSIEAWHGEGLDVTLFGWSLGGDVVLFVIERLLRDHQDLDEWFDAVVLDAPSGLETLKQVPGWLPEKLIVSPIGSVIFTLVGWIILLINRMGVGLPKDEFITRPDARSMKHMSGRNNFSNVEWKSWVKQEFKRSLRGHRVKPWRQQIQWMVKIVIDGSFDRALKACDGQHIAYVACTKGNDVIEQPLAATRWVAAVYTIWTLEATHAGFLQMQPECKQTLTPLLE